MKLNSKPRARLVIITLTLGIFALTLLPRCYTIWQLNEQKHFLELEKQEALQINQELAHKKDILNTPMAVERIAREQLGMVKSGEKVIMEVQTNGP